MKYFFQNCKSPIKGKKEIICSLGMASASKLLSDTHGRSQEQCSVIELLYTKVLKDSNWWNKVK